MAGTEEAEFLQFNGNNQAPVEGLVPREEEISIYVNGRELVSLMCTPTALEELALGFLFNEGLIGGMDEVAECRACGTERCVDVWLHHSIDAPRRRTITSGCSGGTTFETLSESYPPLTSDRQVTPAQVSGLMERLYGITQTFRESGGGHASALTADNQIVVLAEDIGRHNTLDKIAGHCLRHGIATQDHVLISTGRVSSEMLKKAGRMGIPVVVSRTSPTSLSIQMARAWNITLIGYARGRHFRVYAGESRVVPATDGQESA